MRFKILPFVKMLTVFVVFLIIVKRHDVRKRLKKFASEMFKDTPYRRNTFSLSLYRSFLRSFYRNYNFLIYRKRFI